MDFLGGYARRQRGISEIYGLRLLAHEQNTRHVTAPRGCHPSVRGLLRGTYTTHGRCDPKRQKHTPSVHKSRILTLLSRYSDGSGPALGAKAQQRAAAQAAA